MMRALEPEMFALLFRLVKRLIPEPPVHPIGGGRPRIDDETCFKGLFWRLVTGAAWETIEVFLDHAVSDTTLRARRDEWIEAGVFEDLMAHALAEYERLIGIDTSDVIVDGSVQLAPGGGPNTAKYPGSKGRKGYKWSCGVDGRGVGIGFVVDTGSRNDYRLLRPTLDQIFATAGVNDIGRLHLDRGYGYKSLPDSVADYPIGELKVIPRNQPGQGRILLAGFGHRWIVERTNAWLTNFRQLKINWDRTSTQRYAALCLAFAILTIYKLVDHCNANNLPLEAIR